MHAANAFIRDTGIKYGFRSRFWVREYEVNQASVLSVTPFLDFCENYKGHENFSFQRCGYPDGSSKMIWEESRNYHKAIFGTNLIYITGSVPEQLF